MNNEENISRRELYQSLEKLQQKNFELIADVVNSINNLKETEKKLDEVRAVYENSWRFVIKKNYKTSCFTLVVLLLAYLFIFLKYKNVNFENGKTKVSIHNQQNIK
ncbi:MAG: hypothetical protein ACKO47_06345 [Alphaproteobacteria bacterium]